MQAKETKLSEFMIRKNLYRLAFGLVYPVVDFIVLSMAIVFSYKLYRLLGIGQHVYYEDVHYISISLSAAAFTVIMMMLVGVYEKEAGLLNVEEIKKTVQGITLSFLLFGCVLVFGKILLSRYVLLFSYVFSVLFVVTEKMFFYNLPPLVKPVPGLHQKILIYGAGELGQALYREIVNSPRLRIIPVGFIDDDRNMAGRTIYPNGYSRTGQTTVLGTGADVPRLTKAHDIDEVYVAISNIGQEALIHILENLKANGISTCFVPKLYKLFLHQIRFSHVGSIPVVREEKGYFGPYVYVKRYVDLVLAMAVLVVSLPLVGVAALLIKKDSSGPVFFTHERIGKNGKPFRLYKFRTMQEETSQYEVSPLSPDDPRITRIGRFLRKTSLDELPQIINVLKGEMSLVGPRPEMPFIVATYDDIHKARLAVLPGITGLWQLSADRRKPIHENMDYDLYYINKMSFSLDITILINTLFFAVRGI